MERQGRNKSDKKKEDDKAAIKAAVTYQIKEDEIVRISSKVSATADHERSERDDIDLSSTTPRDTTSKTKGEINFDDDVEGDDIPKTDWKAIFALIGSAVVLTALSMTYAQVFDIDIGWGLLAGLGTFVGAVGAAFGLYKLYKFIDNHKSAADSVEKKDSETKMEEGFSTQTHTVTCIDLVNKAEQHQSRMNNDAPTTAEDDETENHQNQIGNEGGDNTSNYHQH